MLGKNGFVLLIWKLSDISKGEILEQTASARFTVKFSCIIQRPVQGEVVDVFVTTATNLAVIARCGPLEVVLPLKLLPLGYKARRSGCWGDGALLVVNLMQWYLLSLLYASLASFHLHPRSMWRRRRGGCPPTAT